MNLLKEFRWDAADPSVLVPTRSENGVSKVKNSRENEASIVCVTTTIYVDLTPLFT